MVKPRSQLNTESPCLLLETSSRSPRSVRVYVTGQVFLPPCWSRNGAFCLQAIWSHDWYECSRPALAAMSSLIPIGRVCRHGESSCLWDEEATFGVPASLTACNRRNPESLMASKTELELCPLTQKIQCPLQVLD
ncbi:UNVERIFIED_CONTAM: hypothetical protein FKN15_043995 [Acipenser sinensis]